MSKKPSREVPEHWPMRIALPGEHTLAIHDGFTVSCETCSTPRIWAAVALVEHVRDGQWNGTGGCPVISNSRFYPLNDGRDIVKFLINHSRRDVLTRRGDTLVLWDDSFRVPLNDEAWTAAVTMVAMGLSPWEALDVYAESCRAVSTR